MSSYTVNLKLLRQVCVLITCTLLLSCAFSSCNTPTAVELEDRSVSSGRIKDTILLQFYFGMTETDVKGVAEYLCHDTDAGTKLTPIAAYKDGYAFGFQTDRFNIISKINFYFDYDNNLFRIESRLIHYSAINKNDTGLKLLALEEDLIEFMSKNKKSKPRTGGTQSDAKCYWLDGNMRVDFLHDNASFMFVHSDIRAERKILAINAEKAEKIRIAQEREQNRLANRTIEQKVAEDAVIEYEIAARQGDKMQMYVQAGMCCAAFLQAHDEANYRKWKDIEHNIGRQIGAPQY